MNIKELSRELGVSEPALRSWCKRNGVRKESESEAKGKKAGYLLTENDVESIKIYYSAKGKQEKGTKKGNESKTLDILAEQLVEKDKQIASLLEQLKAKDAQLLEQFKHYRTSKSHKLRTRPQWQRNNRRQHKIRLRNSQSSYKS